MRDDDTELAAVGGPAKRPRPPHRLTTLDALRGVAAAIVVLHHAGPRLAGIELLPGGYLAVDFFFMLSGFVIARRYEPRWRSGLSLADFARARLARLYPVIASGILLGALVAAMTGNAPALLGAVLIAELLFVPRLAGSAPVFPLDGVQWSLLFELGANAAHPLALRRLSTRMLGAAVGVAALALLATARHHGTLGVGATGADLAAGVPRVAFPYLMGVLVHRLREAGRLPRFRARPAALVAALAGTLAAAGPLARLGWAAGPIIVMIAFPPLLLLGADAVERGASTRAARWLGGLSYPLYALHGPLIGMTVFLATRLGAGPGLPLLAIDLLATLAIASAAARACERKRRPPRIMVRRGIAAGPLYAADTRA